MDNAGKPIRCKAAVCRKAGEALEIEEVEVAPPKAREVRIRVICSSLCHSDYMLWKMTDPPAIFPRIFGHEAIGVVESLGEGVNEVKEGDVVIPTFISDCQECKDCLSEKSNLCSKLPHKISPWMPRDGTSRFKDSKGQILYHFLNISSFSEYTVVDIAHITKVDPSIPPSKACLLSCGISTGFGAAWKTAKVEKGSSVAIFGLGAVGLAVRLLAFMLFYPIMVAEGARVCGASRIIGVDLNPTKFDFGKKFGLTDFINPKDHGDTPVSEVIKEMTDGGVDYSFECVGSVSIVYEAFASCRKGWGKTIVMGVDTKSFVSISSYDILHSGKTIMGSLFGNIKAKSDIPYLLQRYVNKELNLDDFVTHEVGFEDINKAFGLLQEGKCLRCVIWMDGQRS